MSPDDYECIMVAAKLAEHHKTWGFIINLYQLKAFLSGHWFTSSNDSLTFEVDTKKMDLNACINGVSAEHRVKFHFIRIGILANHSPRKVEMQKYSDGRMIVTPPRLNGLRIKQQSFRQCMEHYKWNYILDADCERGHEPVISPQLSSPPSPLTMTNTVSIITPVPMGHKKRKLNETEPLALDDIGAMETLYPHLSRAIGGIEKDWLDATNSSIINYMQGLLTELTHYFSAEYELKVKDIAKPGHIIHYVRVPTSISNRSFQNSKEWFDTAIQIAGAKHGGTYESAYRIANHLIRFYKDSVEAACLTQRIPICEPMSATAFQAMLHAGKVSGTGERELKKHLRAHLGKGGSLNGKDIKKVMNNASHIFDQFAVIFKDGKRPDCILSVTNIDALCLHFREVFVLWDGAFSLARTVNPTENDTTTYMRYVSAAIHGNTAIRCTITPKVHLMLKHVPWQMRNIQGGLGDKMEDWVERLHQTGMRERQRFRTVQNPIIRALAREKAGSRNMHPDVLAQVDKTNEGSKRNLVITKVDAISTRRKRQRDVGRQEAIEYFDRETNKELTWSVLIFDGEKVDAFSKNETTVKDS